MTDDAYSRLLLSRGSGWYCVDAEHEAAFVQATQRAEAIYGQHALSWALDRQRERPDIWRETGPEFREDADRRHRARLRPRGQADDRFPCPASVCTTSGSPRYSRAASGTVAGLGPIGPTWATQERPPIDPERMTDAMRLAQALARAIAPRLSTVVPEPFSVVSHQEIVVFNVDGRPLTWHVLVDIDPETAIETLLRSLQDEISEELTVPWPHDPARGYVFDEPHVERRADAIHMWYGPENHPALVLDPLALAELPHG